MPRGLEAIFTHKPLRRRLLTVLGLGGLASLVQPSHAAVGFDVQAWPAGKPVPDLQGTDLTGTPWRLRDLRGKAVLVNFWASWCEPCRAEMPSLDALAQRLAPQGVVVLTVNLKEPLTTVQRFVQQTGLRLPVLQDLQGDMARQWGIRIYPSTVLIAADGRVRGTVRGEVDWMGVSAQQLLQPLVS
jgi:thiol-disulfide isomerase/thioredoxin